MVSAVKWQTTTTVTSIMTTAMNSLANNTITAASTEVANQTGLNRHWWVELNVNFGTAPSDTNPTVDVYISQAMDGTNYDSAPITGGAQQEHLLLRRIPVRKVNSAQRLIVKLPGFEPPHKFKLYLDNQTGQAFPASGSTLDIGVNNIEGQ